MSAAGTGLTVPLLCFIESYILLTEGKFPTPSNRMGCFFAQNRQLNFGSSLH